MEKFTPGLMLFLCRTKSHNTDVHNHDSITFMHVSPLRYLGGITC